MTICPGQGPERVEALWFVVRSGGDVPCRGLPVHGVAAVSFFAGSQHEMLGKLLIP